MSSNISHLNGLSRMGLCLPKECTQHHYNVYSETSVNLINSGLALLPSYGIILHGSLFRTFTRVSMSLTKSDHYTEDWVDRTTAGFIPTIILISLIVLYSLTATFMVLYRKFKDPVF